MVSPRARQRDHDAALGDERGAVVGQLQALHRLDGDAEHLLEHLAGGDRDGE
ncbi:hypothetical protein DEJ36_10765 [Curtobacterium sp. MCPF17_052]|nr:hypothetical protein [Curtobacterium sp. MCPF17_052]WIB11472.1 hypothetical protein DEJ36_10765 [Curtobacterium sp. MCPF17_052]